MVGIIGAGLIAKLQHLLRIIARSNLNIIHATISVESAPAIYYQILLTLAALPSSLEITWPAVDIFLRMLLPRLEMSDSCLCRLGSDLVESRRGRTHGLVSRIWGP